MKTNTLEKMDRVRRGLRSATGGKKFDIITVGGATEDVTLHTSEGVSIDNKKDALRQKLLGFEYGAKINIEGSNTSFGGGAANVAVAASLLGLKTAAMVAVGDDSRGENIRINFLKKGVDVSMMQTVKGRSSGISFLLVGQDNEHIVFSSRAANSHLKIGPKEIKNLSKAEWNYITSLSGKWESDLKNIFKAKGVRIAWNPGHIQLKAGVGKIGKYLKKTSVLIVNKDEAIELVASDPKYKKKEVPFLSDIDNLLSIIKSFGPEVVVITNGQYGANAVDAKNRYYQPIIKKREKIDTTGVGDSFGSSFVAGLKIYKGDIRKSLLLGARNSASNLGVEGAQDGLLSKKDIK